MGSKAGLYIWAATVPPRLSVPLSPQEKPRNRRIIFLDTGPAWTCVARAVDAFNLDVLIC